MNDLFLVFLSIKKTKLFKESWVFVADRSVIFLRVSKQKSFDENMVKKDRTIVCCEVMINKFNKNFSDQQQLIKQLKICHIKDEKIEVLDKKLVKLFKSYPVYEKEYEIKLRAIIDKYDSIDNFYTIGRQGSFNYIGTLDCMDIGFGFVKWLKNQITLRHGKVEIELISINIRLMNFYLSRKTYKKMIYLVQVSLLATRNFKFCFMA